MQYFLLCAELVLDEFGGNRTFFFSSSTPTMQTFSISADSTPGSLVKCWHGERAVPMNFRENVPFPHHREVQDWRVRKQPPVGHIGKISGATYPGYATTPACVVFRVRASACRLLPGLQSSASGAVLDRALALLLLVHHPRHRTRCSSHQAPWLTPVRSSVSAD